MKPLSMRGKFAVAVAAATVFLMVLGAFAWRNNVAWQDDVHTATRNAQKQAAMSDAQDAVWVLRWELGNYMTNDEKDRRRILDEEPGLYKRFEAAMQHLGDDASLTAQEKQIRDRVLTAFRKYAESRPKFFQLWSSGDYPQANAWRAETTTKFGKEMTVALGELIRLEAKSSETENQRSARESQSATATMSILIAAVFAMMAGTGFWVSRSVLKQLGGEPAYAVSVAERVAGGDLSVHVETRSDDGASLLHALSRMRADLAASVSAIQLSADKIDSGAKEIARGNADLSSRTEEQASSLEETASSMEQLSSTV